MNIQDLSVAEIVQSIERGTLSNADCLEHFHDVTASTNATWNAFRDFDFASPTDGVGALRGVPVAVKDGICTRDFATTACSSILSEFKPPYDATVVSKLRAAGAVVVGKTNMDEFAMGSSTENSYFGSTKNPWNACCVPGGSSGGSAAAVAAGMVPLALGSDTGGSIRQPAAFCGITGLKPTYGRVSRLGLIAFASSLDQVGPMGRSAADVATMLTVIAGHDPLDSTSAQQPVPDYARELQQEIAGLRIGICPSQFSSEVDQSVVHGVREALQQLTQLGAEIVEIELPHEKYAVATYYVVAPCEAASNLARYDGVRYTSRSPSKQLTEMYTKTRSEHFGAEVRRRILLGTYALSSGYYDQYYVKASRVRRLIQQDFENAFKKVDLIAGPTTPTTAFPLGDRVSDPIQMYLADVFTVSANLAGIPALSIPCGFAAGLPIGLQLQGPAFGEGRLLRVAHQYQSATSWHQRRPD